jgi:thiol-disulfide isomerase/thioredoxin
MSRRTKRLFAVLAAVVATQAAAVLLYRTVERRRTGPSTFAGTSLRGELAPVLAVERPGGMPEMLHPEPRRALLVHFWATWCAPCREELPALLAFGRRLRPRGIELVAVAVEDDWAAIRTFFQGAIPGEVRRARDRSGHRRYGVSTLPDTYLVVEGKLVERFSGVRDWRSPAAEAHLVAALRSR